MRRFVCLLLLLAICLPSALAADAKDEPTGKLPLVAKEDFEGEQSDWEYLDPKSWKVVDQDGDRVLSQHVKASSYKPPFRSPFHVAVWHAPAVGDLELTARVRSTNPDYGGRDACLIFGYQDPAHYYYAHLGKRTDQIHNQIHIVDGADRRKITKTTNKGTPWDDQWHTVRVVRDVKSGDIKVYWDDQKEPVMTAVDKTFAWGRVGVGTFDDTADWDDIELRGVAPKIPVDRVDTPSVTPRF
ncbi:hypothetical protein KOR34_48710 [Posidoniimonas corsicana]|uniref:Laminin G domain protein n=1 Tax=Posidoniimonas corsicana TaxID=1938618 RepID=A0A5C5UXE5_9BACT|nr:hypothetical protein [Posidoniimonas corsicana]TWT30313.1 hypothetical protein KOR34_48710 [Posidoniimonas corsicana]